MSYGVTQQMIDTYGEIIFKLSLNKQSRRGDAVRELNFEEIEKQRETTGLTDDEIAARIGLLPEQVGVVRVFVLVYISNRQICIIDRNILFWSYS